MEGMERGRAGLGGTGKIYMPNRARRGARFIGAWMYDGDCCQLRCVTRVLILNVHVVPCDWLWIYIKEGACVSTQSMSSPLAPPRISLASPEQDMTLPPSPVSW